MTCGLVQGVVKLLNSNARISRRAFSSGVAVLAIATAIAVSAEEKTSIIIYKSPSCDCCQKWADHLANAGFATKVINRGGLTALKAEWGIPPALQSCHSAKVAGYAIEGHVPASAIMRLLAERPQGLGLAVPGMPIGSPGMEGGAPEIYEVVLFDNLGTRPFARFRGVEEVNQ